MDNAFQLKPSMLLGTGSAATQIDGGSIGHTWNAWAAEGHVRGSGSPKTAAGHWERWREDVLLLHRLRMQTYRFGIEWARVEPEEGVFDEEAIAHIKEEVMLLIGMGITPLLTLQHFTNPLWFERKGGWEEYENVRLFLLYVEKIIKAMGHLINEYITFDEPNVYATNGYMTGAWPPGERKTDVCMGVMSNLASAHIKAYRLIHDMRRSMGFKDTRVGFACRLQVFAPKSEKNAIHRRMAAQGDRILQSLLAAAMATGDFRYPLRNRGADRHGAYCDFHALNYYCRVTVGYSGASVDNGGPKSDLGWEIYPEGIVECCRKLAAIAPLPIYITANGICAKDDTRRCRYIYEHLKAIAESGMPVKRYYYWCFLDGFEWLEGNRACFGLTAVNRRTMQRTVKPSGEFFSEIARCHAVSQELYDRYVAGTRY